MIRGAGCKACEGEDRGQQEALDLGVHAAGIAGRCFEMRTSRGRGAHTIKFVRKSVLRHTVLVMAALAGTADGADLLLEALDVIRLGQR